jgi:hypothetical protein
MEPEQWLARLRATLPGGVAAVSEAEREALLDLARVAAHASERWAAPVATFLAGVAMSDVAPPERAGALRAVITEMEASGPADASRARR